MQRQTEAELFDQSITYPAIARAMLEKTLKAHRLNENSTVIDVWCRTGQLARRVAGLNPAPKVIGLDNDAEMINFAKQHHPMTNLTFEIADSLHPDYVNAADLVISAWQYPLLPHDQRHAHLEKLQQYLKPGGTLLLLFPKKQTVLMDCVDKVTQAASLAYPSLNEEGYVTQLEQLGFAKADAHSISMSIKFRDINELRTVVETELNLHKPNLNLAAHDKEILINKIITEYLSRMPRNNRLIPYNIEMITITATRPTLVDVLQKAGGSPVLSGERKSGEQPRPRCGY